MGCAIASKDRSCNSVHNHSQYTTFAARGRPAPLVPFCRARRRRHHAYPVQVGRLGCRFSLDGAVDARRRPFYPSGHAASPALRACDGRIGVKREAASPVTGRRPGYLPNPVTGFQTVRRGILRCGAVFRPYLRAHRLGLGDVDLQLAPAHGIGIEHADRFVGPCLIGHRDKGKAA